MGCCFEFVFQRWSFTEQCWVTLGTAHFKSLGGYPFQQIRSSLLRKDISVDGWYGEPRDPALLRARVEHHVSKQHAFLQARVTAQLARIERLAQAHQKHRRGQKVQTAASRDVTEVTASDCSTNDDEEARCRRIAALPESEREAMFEKEEHASRVAVLDTVAEQELFNRAASWCVDDDAHFQDEESEEPRRTFYSGPQFISAVGQMPPLGEEFVQKCLAVMEALPWVGEAIGVFTRTTSWPELNARLSAKKQKRRAEIARDILHTFNGKLDFVSATTIVEFMHPAPIRVGFSDDYGLGVEFSEEARRELAMWRQEHFHP